MRQKTIILSILFTIILPGCLVSVHAKDEILLQENFNSKDSGLASRLLNHDLITFAPGAGPDGSDAILVDYVGYDRGSKRVVVRYPLSRKVSAATLSYDVCFSEDFKWVLGGKLHGLGPESPVTGGKPRRPDGWSARVNFKSRGQCATYLYDQDPEKTYGIGDISNQPVFRKGTWHHVVLQVTLNNPGKSDGQAVIQVDGNTVVRSDNIRFRGSAGDTTEIQLFLFSTFHGGSSPKYTPLNDQGLPTTVHALFDNFLVTTRQLGAVGVPEVP